MTVPDRYLDPAMWRGFNVDALYTGNEVGEVRPKRPSRANTVYNPPTTIPAYVFCRVSDSTKRLENGLEAEAVDLKCPEGSVFRVLGSGSVIGVVFVVSVDVFAKAHCTPDGASLLNASDLDGDPIIKPIFEYKTFRAFRIGPPDDDDAPHDLQLTAKKRWFRKRNNPKFLGFSKDDKV